MPSVLTSESSLAEAKASKLLEAELTERNAFEPESFTKKREAALTLVISLFTTFVDAVTREQTSRTSTRSPGCKVVPYGSVRLGVQGPESDLDLLGIAPKNIKREDFSTRLVSILEGAEGVTNVLFKPGRVPHYSANVLEVPVDLSFASLNLDRIPADLDIQHDWLLDGMEETCMISLNGPRTIEAILNLVPNLRTFRDVLGAVRIWATERGIYSNVVGFLGGIGWAVLVAYTCLLYPGYDSAGTFRKFFDVMVNWKWPQPIYLKDAVKGGSFATSVWDAETKPADRAHLMPIITPAYPSGNCSYNVTESTLRIMIREFNMAQKLIQEIIWHGEAWSTLFVPYEFFGGDYRLYLLVMATSAEPEKHRGWSSTATAKLRLLVKGLDKLYTLQTARPYTEVFTRVFYCLTDQDIQAVRAGQLSAAVLKRKLRDCKGALHHKLSASMMFVGLDVDAKFLLNISPAVEYFKEECQKWDGYNPNTMHVAVTGVQASEVGGLLAGVATIPADRNTNE